MSVKLISIGDVMPGENVHHFNRGMIRKYNHRYPDLVDDGVKQLLNEADLLILNLESAIAPEDYISRRNIQNGVYIAPENSLQLIGQLNRNVVANVANNHFGQHGTAVAETAKQLIRQKGIRITGVDNSPCTLSLNGMLINIWGVSLVEDRHECGAYFKSSYDRLISDLNTGVKAENEFRIISIHWGEEYYTLSNERQHKLAEKLAEAGFDLVLGHHPHVIQPFERIGNTGVIYSHGNFLFDQNFSRLTQKGLISVFNLPDTNPNLLFSQQKGFRVTGTEPVSSKGLAGYCKSNYSRRKPTIMRIKMKLELLFHFYDLNGPVIRTFFSRFFRKAK